MHKTSTKSSSKSHTKVIKKSVKKSDLEKFSTASSSGLINTKEKSSDKSPQAMLMEGKKSAKQELFGAFQKGGDGKTDFKMAFLIIFATDLNGDKELISRDFLFKFLEGCLAVNVKVMVVDTEQPSDLNNLGELVDKHAGHVIWYNPKVDNSGKGREEKEIDRLLLAADMAIVFNRHTELMQLLMNYGVVMIAEEGSPYLENYKPNEETGNAFLHKKKDLWSVYACLVRALETYKFPYDWNHIIRKISK